MSDANQAAAQVATEAAAEATKGVKVEVRAVSEVPFWKRALKGASLGLAQSVVTGVVCAGAVVAVNRYISL